MAALVGLGMTPNAGAKPLRPDQLKAIDARLVPTVESSRQLSVQPGDTIFVVHKKNIPARRIAKSVSAYEGVVTGIVTRPGVVVHNRLDAIKLTPKGQEVEVAFTYAIHLDPTATSGGKVRFTLNVMERTGLGNVLASAKVQHHIKVAPRTPPTKEQLAADFYGYRRHHHRARVLLKRLRRRVRGLSLKDQSRIPPLGQVSQKAAIRVLQFERERRRLWVAHRHLVSALQNPDPKMQDLAGVYLKNLQRKRRRFAGVPVFPWGGTPSPVAESVTTQEAAQSPGPASTDDGVLKPVGSYEPNAPVEEPDTVFAEDEKPEPPRAPVTPEPQKPPVASEPPPPEEKPRPDEDEDDVLLGGFFEDGVRRKLVTIPGHPRGLVLDDPNIAHAAGFRASLASVTFRESAFTPAFFFYGQLAVTRSVGVELTVPTEYVNLDLERARSVFRMGNPLVALKYRIHLPKIMSRRPALTIRARWGIPMSPLNAIPPTTLGAEEFSREAHFADTYAFFLEKTDLGLGFNLAWEYSIFSAGFQFYLDYFFPVSDAINRSKFLTVSYGTSIGARPFGDIVGFYFETRTTSLMAGPTRTEVFTYLGARGKFLDILEPALWLSLPFGSVSNVTGLQAGIDLRVTYDLNDVLDSGKTQRGDINLFE